MVELSALRDAIQIKSFHGNHSGDKKFPLFDRYIRFRESTHVDAKPAGYAPINPQAVVKQPTKASYKSSTEIVDTLDSKKFSEVNAANAVLSQVQLEWTKVTAAMPGLRNLGNTCFLNSVLQCLVHTAPLVNMFLQSSHSSGDCRVPGFCSLCFMRQHVCKSVTGVKIMAPTDLIRNIKVIAKCLKPGRQEDAHEFLRFLLDSTMKHGKLHRDKLPGVMIKSIFTGSLVSSVKCDKCNQSSHTYDPFEDIALGLRGCDSVSKAMERFTKTDRLTGSNKYKCEHCDALCDATKQMQIHDCPPVLTVQLKRFEMGMMGGAKVNKHVSFEDTMTVQSLKLKKDIKYHLCGVLVHAGHNVNSGHYYSFVKGSSGMWSRMDDETVQRVKLQSVLDQQAYILFYVQDKSNKLSRTSAVKSMPSPPASPMNTMKSSTLIERKVLVAKEVVITAPPKKDQEPIKVAALKPVTTLPKKDILSVQPAAPKPVAAEKPMVLGFVNNAKKLADKPSDVPTEPVKEPVKQKIVPIKDSISDVIPTVWNTSFDVVRIGPASSKRPSKSELEYDQGRTKRVKTKNAWTVFDRNENPFTHFQSGVNHIKKRPLKTWQKNNKKVKK